MFTISQAKLILLRAAIAGLAIGATALLFVRVPTGPVISRTMQAALSTAQRNACAGYQTSPGSYQVVLQQEYPGTAIVLYAAQCNAARKPRQAVQGYVARASALGLGSGQASCGGGSAYDANSGILPAGGLVTVTTVFCPYAEAGLRGGYSLVWGEIVAAVGEVDVTLADGRVIRADRNGRYFAAVVPRPVEACTLHILDRRPSLLSEHELRGHSPVPLPTGWLTCP